MRRIGIIGGSGLYEIEGMKNMRWEKIDTPFGKPSDEYMLAELSGVEVAFLPRHGRGHRISPTELNYPANIYGMEKLRVDTIISVSAVGSLKKEIKPLDFLIPDQYVDRTNQGRKTTLFGDGIVAHVSLADPSCVNLGEILHEAGKSVGVSIHMGGTYINMEGPAFSTKAESRLYQSWGMDVIGMTNMPEARCAREAEICYTTLAMVTDYDCWHGSEDVSVDMIIQNLMKNVDNAKKILKEAIPKLADKKECSCNSALKDAIITRPELIPDDAKKRLDIIIGKYIK